MLTMYARGMSQSCENSDRLVNTEAGLREFSHSSSQGLLKFISQAHPAHASLSLALVGSILQDPRCQ